MLTYFVTGPAPNKELNIENVHLRKCSRKLLKSFYQSYTIDMLNLMLNIQRNTKKYETALPSKKIIDYLPERMDKVEIDRINSVEIVGDNVFNATSSDLSSTHRLK